MKLKRWQHSLISLVILIALLALVFVTCIQPAMDHYEQRQETLAEKMNHLQKFRSIASQQETLIPYYEKLIKQNRQNTHFLANTATSLAAANLQERVKKLIEKNQGQLVSTQPVNAQTEGLFTPVMIRIHMKTNTQTLLNVFHDLESGKPTVFIENLQIQQLRSSKKTKQRTNATYKNRLDTRFDLKVYMLKPGGKA